MKVSLRSSHAKIVVSVMSSFYHQIVLKAVC
uniref:Uncharacterized protein n=1 Tax=Arundo donax TaxID=35708 RepID=A0A0A8Y8N7_ARUDO